MNLGNDYSGGNVAFLEELMPGLEEYLCITLAKENLSFLGEEKRQYYVERYGVLRLPPMSPPSIAENNVDVNETSNSSKSSASLMLLDSSSTRDAILESFAFLDLESEQAEVKHYDDIDLGNEDFDDATNREGDTKDIYEVPIPPDTVDAESLVTDTTSSPSSDKDKSLRSRNDHLSLSSSVINEICDLPPPLPLSKPPPLPPRRHSEENLLSDVIANASFTDKMAAEFSSRESLIEGSPLKGDKPPLPPRVSLAPRNSAKTSVNDDFTQAVTSHMGQHLQNQKNSYLKSTSPTCVLFVNQPFMF